MTDNSAQTVEQKSPNYQALIKIIESLRKKSHSVEELLLETKIPRRTLYSTLKVLKDVNLVVEKSGILYLHEYSDLKVYKNDYEADIWLNHSKNIVSGLKHVFSKYLSTEFVSPNIPERRDYQDHALEHLRTGYPSVFKDYEELAKLRRQIADQESSFVDRVVERLRVRVLDASSDLGKLVLHDIKEELTGHEPSYLRTLTVIGEEVVSNPFHLGSKELFESIRNFMAEEEKSTQNAQSCGRIISEMKEYFDLNQRSEEDIKKLMQQVENNTPLDGHCIQCPRIRIEPQA